MMRKVLISLAAAASALVVSSPASAQFLPIPPAYGYGYSYSNYGHARAMKARIDYIQHEIRRLAYYRMISPNEYHSLIRDSQEVEWRLLRNARDGRGLTRWEAYETQRRIARLEQRIAWEVRDGRQWAYRW